jgi:transcriptional regulator with XRE-family HTH domain
LRYPRKLGLCQFQKSGKGVFVSFETVGERIKVLRGSVSQAQFAEMYGLSKNTLWGYENGTTDPRASFVAKLAKDYGVTTDWILFGEGEPPKPELSAREACLIANYRASPEEGQRSVETMASLLAKRDKDLKDVG